MSELFSLAIATPTHRGLFSNSYVQSLWALQRSCLNSGIPVELLTLPNQSMVDRARNILASFFFFKTQCSHMLFVDDDMGFHPEDVMRMLEWRKHEVVAAMYPRKEIDWAHVKQTVLAHPEIDPSLLPQIAGQFGAMCTFLNEKDTPADALDTPMQVREAGTGIMLISRACLQRLANEGVPYGTAGESTDYPVYEFFRQKVIDGRLVGEDFYFCNLVRKHGGLVHACAWPTVVHTGTYEFVGNLKLAMELS